MTARQRAERQSERDRAALAVRLLPTSAKAPARETPPPERDRTGDVLTTLVIALAALAVLVILLRTGVP